jgi:hypothetical protein
MVAVGIGVEVFTGSEVGPGRNRISSRASTAALAAAAPPKIAQRQVLRSIDPIPLGIVT